MKPLLQLSGPMALMIAAGTLAACSSQESLAPAPTPPPAAEALEPAEPESDVLSIQQINEQGVLQPIYFDYDKSEIQPDQRAKLLANAQYLRANTHFRLLIAGHYDERGTREHNMALGERRASATMQYLVSLGVARNRIDIISYGEENPAAIGDAESSWAQTRRVTFHAIEGGER